MQTSTMQQLSTLRNALGSKDLSDIYFETTTGKFKVKPEDVKRLSGLSTKWKTSGLTRIEVGSAGMYMAWDGHRRPHCQELRNKRNALQKLAKSRSAETRNLAFAAKHAHVFLDDLIVVNEGMDLFSQIVTDDARKSLDMEAIFEELYEEMLLSSDVCDRGNIARGSGYASLNQKLKDDKDVTAPQILAGTTKKDIIRMTAITSILRLLCLKLNIDEPFTNDEERNREWATYLCQHFNLPTQDDCGKPSNTMEGLTVGLSACNPPPLNGKERKPILFGTHVDQFNCSMPGFNALFCYYEHFERDGRWYRVVVIGYSRACISAFYRRKDEKNSLKGKLKSYIEYNLRTGRGTPSQSILPNENDSPRSAIAFLDKVGGFYSAPATPLSVIAAQHSKATLQIMCELILPLGWLPTFSNIYPLLDDWSKTGLPDSENYTVTIIDSLRNTHGTFVGGVGARFQPSFNFSIHEKDIEHSLRILLEVVRDINDGCLTFSDKILRQRMRSIHGVGDLGSMHILHLATMCGVIHDASFLSSAHIAKGTNTWETVVSSYNLGEAVLNRMISDLGEELELPSCVIENSLCEFCRDCDINVPFSANAYNSSLELRRGKGDHPRWPDLFFKDQSIFFLRKIQSPVDQANQGKRKASSLEVGIQCVWEIVQRHVTGSGIVVEEVVAPVPLDYNCVRNWQDVVKSKRNTRVVKVTSKSKLRSECKNTGKKKTRLLKPVEHTGMGVHNGLEERLAEREEKRLRKASGAVDANTLDLIHDPTFKGGRVYQMEWLSNYPLQESGRQNSFRLIDVFGATVANLTYRHIDLRSTCIALLSEGGVFPRKKMKRRIKSYFRINSKSFAGVNDNETTHQYYTASINWHTMSALTVKDTPSGLSCSNLMRYHSRLAYYKTKADALRAVMIRTLVKVATEKDWSSTKHDPVWAQRLLPKKQLHAVLYENGDKSGNRDRLFGFLHFRGGRRVLSIPRNYQDLTCPWEDFKFSDYYPSRDDKMEN